MPDAAPPTESTPFDHLDPVPDPCDGKVPQLRTAEIGQLAESIVKLTGISGLLALSAAILIDQGRVSEGLATLADEIDERKAAAEEKALRNKARVHA